MLTNQPDGVYSAPARLIDRYPSRADSEELRSTLTVVWFDEDTPEPFDALRRMFDLSPVLVVDDGAVYRVSPRATGAGT